VTSSSPRSQSHHSAPQKGEESKSLVQTIYILKGNKEAKEVGNL